MRANIPDNLERLKALDTRQSFILEAPAGSGKTELLTARFIALLSEVRHPRQLLAVTFTRKAAAEMSERIASTLRNASKEKKPESEWDAKLYKLARRALNTHSMLLDLLGSPETFLINTFHGFCASIIRQWPLEAEVRPDLMVLDNVSQQALLNRAVKIYVEELVAGKADKQEIEALKRRLAAVNNNVALISEQISDLLKRRDRLIPLIELFQKKGFQQELERRVEQLARRTLTLLKAYFSSGKELWLLLKKTLLDEECETGSKFPADVPGDALEDIVIWQASSAVFLTKGGSRRRQFRTPGFPCNFSKSRCAEFIRGIPVEVADALAFVSSWPEPGKDNVGIDALNDMLALAAGALESFRRCQNTHGFDFLELESAALRALDCYERPSESLIFFHEHLQHILVDEAQDVNDTQVRILGALTEGWGSPGDRRTLFMVGDPKQSIYRFRRAEVSLFEAIKADGLYRKAEEPLRLFPLLLKANFRSCPHLVHIANPLFERVMANPDKDADEVDFAPSQAAGNFTTSIDSFVTIALFQYCKATDKTQEMPSLAEARQAEARYMVNSVASWHHKRPEAKIAILIPARTHLPFYVSAFENAGLPVNLVEGIPMLECPEVRHLLNLFTALLRPYDNVAWAGLLRAPWCFVSNSVLETLAAFKESRLWYEKISGNPGLDPGIMRFLKAYEKVRPDFGREPYSQSLKRIWEELEGPAAVVRTAGPAGLSNAMAFFDLVEKCPEGTGEEALEYLEQSLEAAYTPPDPTSAFSPIALMTIHKAKGLEFDYVYAVGLDYNPLAGGKWQERVPAFLLDRLPGSKRLYLASAGEDRRTGRKTLAATLLANLEEKRRQAEYKRLFYVVSTRAREGLTFSGTRLKRADDAQTHSRQTAIGWLADGYNSGWFKHLPVKLMENPAVPKPSRSLASAIGRLPAPPPFEPEPLPYLIRSPSKIEEETATVVQAGAEEIDPDLRAKGVVIHRIFETLLRGKQMPDRQAVAATLTAEGIAADNVNDIAEQIVTECERAWNFEPFCKLRAVAEEIIPEWAIEDFTEPDKLRVGRIDLMVKTGSGYIILDFKTAVPQGDMDSWLSAEVARYQPQLRAYIEMSSRLLGEKPARFHAVLFFTSIPKWIQVI